MLRRYAATLALLLILGVVGLVEPSRVWAQSAESTPAGAAAESTLRDVYRTQLDSYRTRERAFTIAREQYAQLQTLNALEEAVATSRQAMIERTDVLNTYLELQKAEVENQAGMVAEQQTQLLNELEQLISFLAVHRDELVMAQDRTELDRLNAKFGQVLPVAESKAYQVQALLTVARLRAVFDRTLFLRDEVQTHTATASSDLKVAQRERAFDEIAGNVAGTELILSEVKTKIDESDSFSQTSLSRHSRDLGQAYAGISQLLGFVEEILDL